MHRNLDPKVGGPRSGITVRAIVSSGDAYWPIDLTTTNISCYFIDKIKICSKPNTNLTLADGWDVLEMIAMRFGGAR